MTIRNQGLPEFPNSPVDNMLAIGGVTPNSVRIRLRSSKPGTVRVVIESLTDRSTLAIEKRLDEGNNQDNTLSILLPEAFSQNALHSSTQYEVLAHHVENKFQIGTVEFETSPATQEEIPSTFSIGLMSCHQPFTEKKRIRPNVDSVLKSAIDVFQHHKTKLILQVGDQMYSDYPQSLSFFNPQYFSKITTMRNANIREYSSKQIRELYQLRYRHYWNTKYWKLLHIEFPTYPILDDHNIVDNWGSNKHFQQSSWKALGNGARWAYWDYQGSRIIPRSNTIPDNFHYEIEYGPVGIFVMDIRSNRSVGTNSQMVNKDQIHKLKEFLWGNCQKKILFIVLSVPIIHLPRYLAKAVAQITDANEDFSDRWSTRGHLGDRDRILELIHRFQVEFPDIKVAIPSGDIHIGCAHKIEWESGFTLYQLISSAITHQMPLHIEIAGEIVMRLNHHINTNNGKLSGRVKLLKSEGNHTSNPFGKLNFGIIEIRRKTNSGNYSMRYFLYTSQDKHPVCVYRSPEL